MTQLSVKTKRDVSPSGKARVYFSCHPEDFNEYFDVIGQEIMDIGNCAMYYREDMTTSVEEESLADMQLFVIPVTERFLTTDNWAKNFEFGFAIEHHIPILPILVEHGLFTVFAKEMNSLKEGYGNIQCLDRTSTDTTEVPYLQKLRMRLSVVLAGDELLTRIRKAFSSYIFLSYRKKDREKAMELMKTIHQIPFCQEVAIWYDEYLVPGEEWNNGIEAALKKSSLVALLVTPSILEAENYVVKHEYPGAVDLGKPVIPIEAEPTPHDELFSLYNDLAEPCEGDNIEKLAGRFSILADSERESAPERKYLIGLAYLYAIDVEKDTKRGVSMITEAAEAGYIEALKKLSDMHSMGDGVEADPVKSAEWQEKYALALVKENSDSKDALAQLALSGAYWHSVGLYEKARDMYVQVAEILLKKDEKEMSLGYREMLAICLGKVADAYEREGNVEETGRFREKAIEIFREVAGEDPSEENKANLSSVLRAYGDLCLIRGEYQKALDHMNEAKDICKEMLKESTSVTARERLASCYLSLGKLCEAIKQYDNAIKYYDACLDIRDELAAETEEPFEINRLAEAYEQKAEVCILKGDLDGALENYDYCIGMTEYLAKTFKRVDARIRLARSKKGVGDVHCIRQNLSLARACYEEALRINEALHEEICTEQTYRRLRDSLLDMFNLCFEEGNYDAAEGYLKDAGGITQSLVDGLDSDRYVVDLVLIYKKLGGIYALRKEYEQARAYLFRGLKILKERMGEDLDEECRRLVADCMEDIGLAYACEQDKDSAKRYLTKAFLDYYRLAMDNITSDSLYEMLTAGTLLSEFCCENGFYEDALKFCDVVLDIFSKIPAEERMKEKLEKLQRIKKMLEQNE